MKVDILNQVEKIFYDYTQKYDENIKSIVKDREIELSIEELDEILEDAKKEVGEQTQS